VSINFNELRELLGAIAQTDITELTLKSEDFELTVRKGSAVVSASPVAVAATSAPGIVPAMGVEAPVLPPSEAPAPLSELPEAAAPSPVDKKWLPIASPMVGTFYRAPAPDEPPFVEVGDRIRTGQAVCIIEAMKLMNEIEAEISGQVVEIVATNGEPVEYGQTLMWVNPD
jgi:acetyl-CoA carboxylase biotin carboxyl carrier protein